ncbi:MAG TPA: MaoC family dehydratase [Trueperaceae bacterium]|nr:MaoC family dehydratase [Trueperaceae bacterium]
MATQSFSGGRLYEDFEVGAEYRHWPGRTISEADNAWFTLVTMNTHPIHFDREYASHTRFGRLLVNSCLTLSIVVGMSVRDISQAAIANLGFDNVELPAPVFNGDTLYARSQVLDKRISRSNSEVGIVRFRTIGTNQEGIEVMRLVRAVLVPLRGEGVTEDGGG